MTGIAARVVSEADEPTASTDYDVSASKRSPTANGSGSSGSSSTTTPAASSRPRAGRDKATLEAFFDALGPQRTAALTHTATESLATVGHLSPFVKLARTIRRHLPEIHNMLDCGLSNARVDSGTSACKLAGRFDGFRRDRLCGR